MWLNIYLLFLIHEPKSTPNCTHGRNFNLLFDRCPLRLSVPINKLVSHGASYVLFLGLILLNVINPEDDPDGVELSWYNYMLQPMAVGFLFIDIEQMWGLASAVKIGKRMNKLEAAVARVQGFFGNRYISFRFFGHACFLAGNTTEYLGYKYGQDHHSHLNVTHASNYTDDDESNYVEFHPVKIGVCLQGIAIVIVMTHLLQFLCLHSGFGAVYVGLSKCVSVVFSFALTYSVIIFAFSLSIFTVLRNSRVYAHTLATHKWQGKALGWVAGQNALKSAPGLSAAAELLVKQNVTKTATHCTDQYCYTKCNETEAFHTFPKSIATLLWNAFEPGDDEAVRCSEGLSGFVGTALWYLYNVVATVVLVNLLIALMGVIMRDDCYTCLLLQMRFSYQLLVSDSLLLIVQAHK